MTTFLQQLINGISQGSAYALIALGYTMVYGVLRPDQLRPQRRLHVRRVHGLLHRQQPVVQDQLRNVRCCVRSS